MKPRIIRMEPEEVHPSVMEAIDLQSAIDAYKSAQDLSDRWQDNHPEFFLGEESYMAANVDNPFVEGDWENLVCSYELLKGSVERNEKAYENAVYRFNHKILKLRGEW